MNKLISFTVALIVVSSLACLAQAGALSEEERALLSTRRSVQNGSNFFANKIASLEKEIKEQNSKRAPSRKVQINVMTTTSTTTTTEKPATFEESKKVFADKIAEHKDDLVLPVPSEEQVRMLARDEDEEEGQDMANMFEF